LVKDLYWKTTLLLIGKISKVNKGSNDLWQTAVIDQMGDLSNISIVSIIVP
jgi:hypothetical protein